jgi:glycine betaine/proline transport system ATP-binding protein
MAAKRIVVRGVTKVFGVDPRAVLPLLRSGADKTQILEKTQAVVGLHDVSFDVDEGEILVVMGLSGSGKSTMLRCINRLVEPTEGSIVVDGVEVTSLSRTQLLQFRRAKFGMVFQHFALFPNRTIFDNVAYGLEIQKVEPRLRAEKTLRAIEVVGLKGWEKSYPGQLSGGMQQRAGLARALAVDADILLMDEAFSALDPLIRREMQQELRELQKRLRKTVVFVSHDLDEAIALGGRIVLMKDGGIVQIGTPEEILLRPATDYVRQFVEHIDVSSVLTVERVADRALPTLAPHWTLAEAGNTLRGSEAESWFVVDEAGRAVGCLGQSALRTLPQNSSTVGDAMRTGFARVDASSTLKAALPLLASEHGGIAVVDEGGCYVGSLTSRNALAALAGATGATAPAGHGDASWTGPSPSSRSTSFATKPSLGSRLKAPT